MSAPSRKDPTDPWPAAFPLLIAVCLLAGAALVLVLASLHISRQPTAQTGSRNLEGLWGFWFVSALAWSALTILIAFLKSGAHHASNDPKRFWHIGAFILLSSAALQSAVVLTHQPTLSDDIWRYILDGGHTASGANPYAIAPQSITPDNEQFPGAFELAQRTNNPDLTTIYLPGSQLVFFTIAGIAKPRLADPVFMSVVFRFVMVASNLALVVLILVAIRNDRRSAWWACLYAWHPLVLTEVAASGHQDVLGVAALLLALVLADTGRSHRATSVALWCSTTIKPAALPLLPFILRDQPRRAPWIFAFAAGIIIWIALLIIFKLTPGSDAWLSLSGTFDNFLNRWEHFGSIFEILRFIGIPSRAARIMCAALLVLGLFALWDRRVEMLTAARIFLFGAILLSTTAHPWYLLWPLALFPIRPSPALWIASLTLPWGYVVFADVVNWSVPFWAPLLAYGPVYFALFLDARWRCQRDRDRP